MLSFYPAPVQRGDGWLGRVTEVDFIFSGLMLRFLPDRDFIKIGIMPGQDGFKMQKKRMSKVGYGSLRGDTELIGKMERKFGGKRVKVSVKYIFLKV